MAEEEILRYPIGKENEQEEYKSEFNNALKLSLINDLKHLPTSLDFAIQNLDAVQLETPYRPGGWTVQQLVHHIADSHVNAYTRFKLGMTEDNPQIKPYDQEAWADLPDTRKLPVNISITLLHALHARWCSLMDDITKVQWQRTIYHPEQKRSITLWELLKSYSWHSRHHTAHVLKLRERMGWK
ncbi:MAG TPA: putative metal-dependent hydrolase [Hanamia sp.]|nr:putative metal-dependent hydrolase [Hanamia sp.]